MRIFPAVFLLFLFGCTAVSGGGEMHTSSNSIALNPEDTGQADVGHLHYLGGLHILSGDDRFGGLSGLRWHGNRLHSITDNGRWLSFEPVERNHRLLGVRQVKAGDLHGLRGEALGNSKLTGDAEALTRDHDGNWLVAFEQVHRIWRYPALNASARPTQFDPQGMFAKLARNNGIEALSWAGSRLLLCAEIVAGPQANCRIVHDGEVSPVFAEAPPTLKRLEGVPTDADASSDGTFYVLFRSYSPADGPGAGIATIRTDGTSQVLATLRPPLAVDNMEGIAVREIGNRTFLYLISDDNFSADQRTLLMKFEVSANSGSSAR